MHCVFALLDFWLEVWESKAGRSTSFHRRLLAGRTAKAPFSVPGQWGVETAYLIIDDFMLGPRDLRGRMNFADITIGALYL
jgi:hypothetical protein